MINLPHDRIKKLTEEIVRRSGEVCCGGPRYGTNHAPNCIWERAWKKAEDQVAEEYWQAEGGF